MEWKKLKVKGSWVTLDTPAQKNQSTSHPPPHPHPHPQPPPLCHHPEVSVGLSGRKICMHSRILFLFAPKQTFLPACHSRLDNTSYSMRNHLSLYILHVKYINIISLFREHFLGWSKKSVDPWMCRPTSSQGVSFPLLSLQSESGRKNVN